jgi:very-short-patch-repair endonuclease
MEVKLVIELDGGQPTKSGAYDQERVLGEKRGLYDAAIFGIMN